MALKATIHKASVSFSDLDRNVYRDHEVTIARHPSETEERMMVRLLALVLNAPENNDQGTLELGKDLWEADEPALLQVDLTGLMMHWIEVGQPDEKRLVRVCRRVPKVTVYSFSTSTPTWWSGLAGKLAALRNLTVWQVPSGETEALGVLVERTMDLQFTLQEGVLTVDCGDKSVELHLVRLAGGER
ncbi:MAG: YaeQ family protein [Prosthecobacter sp.]